MRSWCQPILTPACAAACAAAVASLLQHEGFANIVHVNDDFPNAAAAGLAIVTEDVPAREPGWTWIASRSTVREYSPRTAVDAKG